MADSEEKTDKILSEINELFGNQKSIYQKIAGINLGRIRDEHYPNKLSAMAALLQEGGFRKNLQPQDLERQIRRWIKGGLPVENIQEMARALKLPVSEFLVMMPRAYERIHDKNAPGRTDTDFKQGVRSISKTGNKKGLKWAGLIVLMCAFITGGMVFLNPFKPVSIKVIWPDIIKTNVEYISGKISNVSPRKQADLDIKLFVNPLGDSHYWLIDDTSPAEVTETGVWFQKCRFGDEDFRTMRNRLPLKFGVYAALVRQNADFPLNKKKNHFLAMTENDFLVKLKPHAIAVSDRFTVTRVKPPDEDIPIVMGVSPPVKITWSERVPMFLEFYHQGVLIKEGYFDPGIHHELPPSQILYEIKMSRKKAFPQRNIWILVEKET